MCPKSEMPFYILLSVYVFIIKFHNPAGYVSTQILSEHFPGCADVLTPCWAEMHADSYLKQLSKKVLWWVLESRGYANM